METLGFVGGTGPLGRGLALRLAVAGHAVRIGSRSAERGAEAVDKIRAKVGDIDATGVTNDAAADADIVFVTVPYDAQRGTVAPLAERLAGKVVVCCVNALGFDDRGPHPRLVEEGSAAEELAALAEGAAVVGAFQNVSATTLLRADTTIDADVLLTGDDENARDSVAALVRRIPELRPVHAGPLRLSRPIEELTAVLIAVNQRHRSHASVRLTGLPDDV